MSFKEVMGYRKTGDLEKALEMALADMDTNKEDLWNKRAAGWVYYDYLKKYASQIDYREFCKYLDLVAGLKLPEEDHMLFDQIAWQVGKFINTLEFKHALPEDREGKENENGSYKLGVLHNIIISYVISISSKINDFPFSKPSEPYSFLLSVFMKRLITSESVHFLDFADWWNFGNFRPEDFKKRELENGKPYISLAEQAYINYSKQLLKLSYLTIEGQVNRIEEFIPKLDNLIQKYPDLEYPPYFKAKLFLEIGKKEEVRDFILPFVRRKQSEFWVWDLLADTYCDDQPEKMACLCKALSCEAQEKMKINVHQKLATLLHLKGLNKEGEIEESIIKTIKGEATTEGIHASDIQRSKSSHEASLKKSMAFYQKYVGEAEEVLFHDVSQELAVVEFVNKDSKILNFVINYTRAGFLKFDRFLNEVEIGDKLLVRLNGSGINSRFNALTLEKTEREASEEILKKFIGKVKINENMPFGHVEDIFIDPKLINKFQIYDGMEVSGTAIISYNKKKEKWGWKAIKIN